MKFIPAFLIAISLFSCTIDRRIYTSNIINTPLLEKKGDLAFSATGTAPAGFDLYGGAALSDKIAILSGFNTYRNADKEEQNLLFSSSIDSSSLLYRHQSFYLGLGLYLPANKNKKGDFFCIYTGYISGRFRMDEDMYSYNSNGTTSFNPYFYKSRLNKYFLQAGYYSLMNNFSIASSLRFSYAGYTRVQTNYPDEIKTASKLPPDQFHAWSPFADLSLNPKFFLPNAPWLGFEIYTSFTVNLRQPSFLYYPLRGGAGLCIRPGNRQK